MTRNYNDWIIKVEKSEIDSNEFIAEFYIPKTDGREQFRNNRNPETRRHGTNVFRYRKAGIQMFQKS